MPLKINTNLRPGAARFLRAAFRTALIAAVLPAAAAAQEAGWAERWSGPYAGVTLGAVGAGAEISPASSGDFDIDRGSAAIGLVAGHDWAVWDAGGSGLTLGVEADAMLFRADTRGTDAALGDVRLSGNALGAVRLRAGWAWPKARVFLAAGVAVTDLSVKAGGRGDSVRAGLALGAGAEYAVDDSWTARAELGLYGFGEEDRRIGGAGRDVGLGASVLRLGLTRRF